jgi:putative transposase
MMSEMVESAGSEPSVVDGVDIRGLIEKARADGVPLAGPDGLLSQITKTVLETALNAELDEHLGYAKGDPAGQGKGNQRNGRSQKTVHTDVGSVRIEVPRDRNGEFEPRIVPKHARRVEGFDESIISLYAKGLTTGEIRKHLSEIYGVEVSRELISKITDKVLEEMNEWQSRPLERVYPIG